MNESASTTQRGNDADAWFTPLRFALGLFVFIFAFYPEVLIGTRTFVFRDFSIFGYPLAFHHREAFWHGEIPLWNPLSNCGLPFLAQWNTLTLYPLSLIYLLLPLSWSLAFFCLFHQFLAGMGMYYLAHRWTNNRLAASVAGLAFAFNGLTLNSLMWPNNMAALGWMPWVVLLVEDGWQHGRKGLLKAALVGTLQMLAGAPEIILFTWLTIFVVWFQQLWPGDRSRGPMFWRFAGIICAISLLSAVQLLPFIDLLAHSQRDTNFGNASWAMPIWGWANLLVPLFRCYQSPVGVFFQGTQDWTSSYYLGIGVLAFALLALRFARQPRVWLLSGLTLFGLLLALGEGGHVYVWVKKIIPLIGFIRFPVKFVVLAVFAVPLLAAFATAEIARLPVEESGKVKRATIVIGGAMALLIGLIVLTSHWHLMRNEQWDAVWQNGLSRLFFLALMLALIARLARIERYQSQIIARIALLALVAFDVYSHAPPQNPMVTPNVYEPGIVAQRFTPRPHPGGPRALMYQPSHDAVYRAMLANTFNDLTGRRAILFGNCNLLDDIPTTDGFFSLYLPAEREIWARVFFSPTNQYPAGLADFLCLNHITDPVQVFDWAQRPSALPFATAGQMPLFVDPTNTYRLLAESSFNPQQMVYLPLEAKSSITVTNASKATVELVNFARQKIDLTVNAAEPTMLVLSQSFYHPWHAYVNDQPVTIWKGNYAFQALQVPAGQSRVRLVYEDKMFVAGSSISLLTLLACLFTWFRWRSAPMESRNG